MIINVWIHGAFSSSAVWNYHKLRLSSSSDDKTINVSYDITQDDPSRVALACAKQIIAIAKSDSQIVIYGHSYGGNIAIDVAARLSRVIPTHNILVVTLAAPFGGIVFPEPVKWWTVTVGNSRHYTFFNNTSADGIVMERLHDRVASADMCRVVSFISTNNRGSLVFPSTTPNDGVVTVESQTWWSTMNWMTTYDINTNHSEIVQDPEVVELLRNHYALNYRPI